MPNEVILLVVEASDQIVYPQTTTPNGITPDESGQWHGEVQVGNLDFGPQKGQSFTVKMYVVTVDEYHTVKAENRETGGKAKWPSLRMLRRPSERAKTTFALI
jgi:hypothetical protein